MPGRFDASAKYLVENYPADWLAFLGLDPTASVRVIDADLSTVSAEVENTGKRDGDEVVQLYLRDVAASVTRPVKELKGFERVHVRAGERRRVEFTLTPEHLGFTTVRWSSLSSRARLR